VIEFHRELRADGDRVRAAGPRAVQGWPPPPAAAKGLLAPRCPAPLRPHRAGHRFAFAGVVPGRVLGRKDRPCMWTWWAAFTSRSRIDSATTGFGNSSYQS
jgi:hypothetical protein